MAEEPSGSPRQSEKQPKKRLTRILSEEQEEDQDSNINMNDDHEDDSEIEDLSDGDEEKDPEDEEDMEGEPRASSSTDSIVEAAEVLDPETIEKKRKKRKLLAEELVQTERIYVNDLDILVKAFLQPMSNNASSPSPVISQDDVKAVFGNLKVIRGYNQLLLQDLEKAIQDPDAEYMIGAVFTKMAVFLKTYTVYCSDYENALRTLKKLRETDSSGAFLQALHDSPDITKGQINNYLILPVQRIPRYKMLLQDMLKNTWPEHPDYGELIEAVKQITEIALFVEEAQEKFHNMNKIISIQSALVGKKAEGLKLLTPGRIFIKEASLGVQEYSTTGPTTKTRKLFLFNDLLLVTKSKREREAKDVKATKGTKKKNEVVFSYILRKSIYLKTVNAVASATIDNAPAVNMVVDDMSISLLPTDEVERDAWADVLKKYINESIEKGKFGKGGSDEALALKKEPKDRVNRLKKGSIGPDAATKKARRQSTLVPRPPPPPPVDEIVSPNPLFQNKKLEAQNQRNKRLSVSMAEKGPGTPGTTRMNRSNTNATLPPPILRELVLGTSDIRKSPSMDVLSQASGSGISGSTSVSSGLANIANSASVSDLPSADNSHSDEAEDKGGKKGPSFVEPPSSPKKEKSSSSKKVSESTQDKRKMLQRTLSSDSVHKIDSKEAVQAKPPMKPQAKFL